MWLENQHQCLELATEQNRLFYIVYKCHVVKLFAFFITVLAQSVDDSHVD